MPPRRRKIKKGFLDYITLPRLPRLDLDPDTKKGIFIVFIVAFGAICALGLFDLAGLVGGYLKLWLTLFFGWGKWLIPLILIAWGYFLYDDERFEVKGGNYLGLLLFILSFHSLLFLFVEVDQWPQGLKEGFGGGYAGFYFAGILLKLMGFFASLLVAFGLFIVSLLLMLNTTLVGLFGRESLIAKLLFPINFVLAKIFKSKEDGEDEEEDEEDERDDDDEEEEEEEEDEEGEDENNEDEEEKDEEEDDNNDNEDDEEGKDEEEDDNDDDGKNEKAPKFKAEPIELEKDDGLWWKPTNVKINLPLSLLDGKREKPTSGAIEENKEIIQKALGNFGIPVDMGEVSVGPTVTQYTFRPAEGVKLARITTLSNDLALALAAHPIRIEAPIPGKHLVGVEVPNQAKAIVSLREVLTTKSYKERKSNLMLALGKDVAGRSWLDDITKMPHLLVAGATNSGKSVCLNTILVSLMFQNNPDDIRFIMVDPKRVELTVYNGIPYLLTPVITDITKTVNALKWCINEMDRRFDILAKYSQRNIQTYNETAELKMPYIVFVIDELADLMVAAAKDIETGIIRLAQMARAVGIHLILATQRPSVDVITGLIKANMPARIAFSVASGTDSRTILDSLGAEKLLGRGDMLYINAEISKPVRLQGAYVSDSEIKNIVNYIKKKSSQTDYIDDITDNQRAHSPGGFGFDGGNEGDDDLLHEAKEIIIQMNKASASLLQRKLRIGYARAASILDQLERNGVIGPANGAKPREILINKAEFAALENTGVSGVSLHSREESKAPDKFLGDDDDDTDDVEFVTEDIAEDAEDEEEDDVEVDDAKNSEENKEKDAEDTEDKSKDSDNNENKEDEDAEDSDEEEEDDEEENDSEEEEDENEEDENDEEDDESSSAEATEDREENEEKKEIEKKKDTRDTKEENIKNKKKNNKKAEEKKDKDAGGDDDEESSAAEAMEDEDDFGKYFSR